MRVLPLENEAVNECWIADRDRFSYEALNTDDRLLSPMLKQGGEWKTVDWQTALEYVANGLKQIKSQYGAQSIGLLASPHSTLEELHMGSSLMRGLGSENIDHRLRHAEFAEPTSIRWLGTSIASLSQLQRVLVIGSDLRKDHPLFALRIRQAVRNGCVLGTVNSLTELSAVDAWAMPIASAVLAPPEGWAQALADVASAIASDRGIDAPAPGQATDAAKAMAASLLTGERKAILLGNAAAHHANASSLLALANWIGEQCGASVGYLTEAANTVGAQFVGALPGTHGLNARQMLDGGLKAVILLNNEPEFDSAAGAGGSSSLNSAQMVVTLNSFKANMDFSDVLLPIAPFTETPGTFINAEGRMQSFHAVVKPRGQTRPAWKVLRVLANLMELPGFDFETSQDILKSIPGSGASQVPPDRLGNTVNCVIDLAAVVSPIPVVASIYQLDGLVRRATSLQLTTDARQATGVEGTVA
jgi:NADH-quinone oxidoreductase subunit G